jgi:hypothetical protein
MLKQVAAAKMVSGAWAHAIEGTPSNHAGQIGSAKKPRPSLSGSD